MIIRFTVWTIRGYQKLISRYTPQSCRFYPSCSAYSIEAFRLHGFWKGTYLTIHRILRCNPFGGHGLDPVPSNDSHHRCNNG